MKPGDMINLGIAGGVAYALYSLFKKGGPGSGAVNAIAGAIASPYVAVTNWYYGSTTTIPTGNVILPDGTKVPTANLHITWDSAVGVASFVYKGYGYIIPPNPSGGPAYDQNGDYHAQ